MMQVFMFVADPSSVEYSHRPCQKPAPNGRAGRRAFANHLRPSHGLAVSCQPGTVAKRLPKRPIDSQSGATQRR